eukprot:m.48665 g.48665  ORF g.48665 m.48665 type:complete len:239 (-) comp6438_c0_seq1:268-984(-)
MCWQGVSALSSPERTSWGCLASCNGHKPSGLALHMAAHVRAAAGRTLAARSAVVAALPSVGSSLAWLPGGAVAGRSTTAFVPLRQRGAIVAAKMRLVSEQHIAPRVRMATEARQQDRLARIEAKQEKLEQALEKRERRVNKLVELFRKYGRTAVVVYFGLNGTTLAMIYVAVRHGVNVEAIFEQLLGVNVDEYLPEQASAFVLAYVLNHFTSPVRAALTAVITPRVAPKWRARFPRWF